MRRVPSMSRILGLFVFVLLAAAGSAPGQVPAITSNGSLGAISWTDGYYRMIFNTDAMTIDVYTPAGGYTVAGACPPGTYTGPGDEDGCARKVFQPNDPGHLLDIVVYDFTSVYIGTEVYVAGSRPAAIVATGTIAIAGAILTHNGYPGSTVLTPDGAGTAGSGPGGGGGGAGPGYYVATDCGGMTCYEVIAGGGGGSGAGAANGAKGGDSNVVIEIGTGIPRQMAGGAAGVAYLAATGPLQGGSGGGSGGDRMMWGGSAHYGGASGGRGGGALIIATPEDVDISGTVSVTGAAGSPSNDGGGGGGGGGGFLVFQVGGTLTNQATGVLSAAGGGGGAGPGGQMDFSYGGWGGGGIIRIDAATLVNLGTLDVSGVNPGVVVLPLDVAASGTGSGTVSSQVGLVPAIVCSVTLGVASGACSQLYPMGTSVTLTPVPSTGSAFTGWSGACTGTGPCAVSMTQMRHVTATFDLIPYPLTVQGSGTGSGTVASQVGLVPAIACIVTQGEASGACSQMYLYGTSVTLTAAAVDSAFVGWSGACAGTAPCIVSVTQARTVTAAFVVRPTAGAVTPGTGLTSGGTLVTITGTGFVDGGTTVTFGGVASPGVVVAGTSVLTAVTPPGTEGPAVVAVTTAGGTGTLAGAFRYVALKPPGDFTGDGKADVLWRHASAGHIWIWPMDGVSVVSQDYVATVSTEWEIRGAGGQVSTGKAGILWRNAVNGQIWQWTMDGSVMTAAHYVGAVATVYDIVGNKDYTADGEADILWRQKTTGDLWLWEMNGPAITAATKIATVDPAYEVVASGDFNGDGKADILWRSAMTGDVWIWLMNGAVPISQTHVASVGDLDFHVEGVGDVDGDGKADVVWRHVTTGSVWVWLMAGATVTSAQPVGWVPDVGYRIVAMGDYNADGRAELLWHHATRGEVWMWVMDGLSVTSATQLLTVSDVGYQVQCPK